MKLAKPSRRAFAAAASIPAATAHSRLDTTTTNRVLRNTYLLLALSMVPTVIGAALGVAFNIITLVGPLLYFLLFMGVMFGMQFVIFANRDNASGVAWMLVFTGLMGYFLGPMLGIALQSFTNGAELIATAFGGTAAIFFGLAGYASTTKRDFSSPSMGRTLFIGMWMLFVIGCVNIYFANSAVALAVSSLFIFIASGFIVFTINRIVRGGETNYILAALTIYIMLLNLFQSLLHLLMIFAGNRE